MEDKMTTRDMDNLTDADLDDLATLEEYGY